MVPSDNIFMKDFLCILFLIITFNNIYAEPVLLRWSFKENDSLYIEKFTVQEILKNNTLARRYAIRDEYRLNVTEKNHDIAFFKGEYNSFEKNIGDSKDPWLLTSQIPLFFGISSKGFYTIPANTIYPTIRDIPAFPDNPVSPNDKWELPGKEIFPFNPPVEIPVNVKYEFLETKKSNNTLLAILRFSYSFDHVISPDSERPWRYAGESESLMFFDILKGNPVSIIHSYNISFVYNDYTIITYRGTLTGTYHRSQIKNLTEQKRLEKDIISSLNSKKDYGVNVKKDERGIIISLEDIFFEFDSDRIVSEMEPKLHKIGKTLKNQKNISLFIEGHTDDVGSEDYNQILSERRAKSVLSWLIEHGYTDIDSASFTGKGEKEPIASNATEEGRKKNRRVEIIIKQE